jgi:hypothetical protein
MTNNAVTVASGAHFIEQFFGQKPFATNWDEIIEKAKDCPSNMVEETIKKLQSYEPVPYNTPYKFDIWKLQQVLRIALRAQKGLPQTSEHTCGLCGTRKAHPFTVYPYQGHCCLHCVELYEQLPTTSNRDHSTPVAPLYDPRTGAWGITFYFNNYDIKMFLFMAIGYTSFMEAALAILPVQLYDDWCGRNHQSGSYRDVMDVVFSVDDVMKERLPLNPVEFEAFIRNRMREHYESEKEPYVQSIKYQLSNWASDERYKRGE